MLAVYRGISVVASGIMKFRENITQILKYQIGRAMRGTVTSSVSILLIVEVMVDSSVSGQELPF